jgi:ribosomal protein S18 acetylase RimI-like enzyme
MPLPPDQEAHLVQREAIIRPYHPADLPRVLEITADAFAGVSIDYYLDQLFGDMGTCWQERKCAAVRADLEAHPEWHFVAEVDGVVCGYVTCELAHWKSLGRIVDLAVARELRGHGIGRRLLERALAFFRAQGLRFAKIETLEPNTVGQRLYPSVGFREVVRQIHYAMRLDDHGDDCGDSDIN